jgi:hypothetical protein
VNGIYLSQCASGCVLSSPWNLAPSRIALLGMRSCGSILGRGRHGGQLLCFGLSVGHVACFLNEPVPAFIAHALVPPDNLLVYLAPGSKTFLEEFRTCLRTNETPARARLPALVKLETHFPQTTSLGMRRHALMLSTEGDFKVVGLYGGFRRPVSSVVVPY